MSTPFTEVFSGSTIYPSDCTYLNLEMDDDVELSWPIEQQIGGNIVADIIDIDASAAGLFVDIPDARQVSTGYTALFNNVGAETVTIRSATGATLVSLVSGTCWQIYLTDNSTEGGTWRVFQYGASVSTAVAAALAGAGLKAITTTLNLAFPVTNTTTTPLTLVNSDRSKFINWTGGVGAVALPDPADVGNDWNIILRNSGSGDWTVTPAAGDINGSSTLVLAPGESALIVTDGTAYYTLSGAGGTGAGFSFISIDVSGGGNYTLSGAELGQVGYEFTGTLTADREIVVPGTTDEYWVYNNTTGSFTLSIRTGTQVTGIQVPQGDRKILYCDGTDVVAGESSTVTFPIPVASGGTGANNAPSARTNLGAAAAAITISAGTGMAGGGDLSANRTLSLSHLGIQSLTDPNADRILFWDDSAGATAWLTVSSGLTLSGTTLTADLQTVSTGLVNSSGTVSVDRTGTNGNQVGYLDAPINTQNNDYTLVMTDRGKTILHTSSTPHSWTVPANASVAFPTGTIITLVNADATGTINILASGTLLFAGTTLSGARTLTGPAGVATLIKVATDTWIVSGVGIS